MKFCLYFLIVLAFGSVCLTSPIPDTDSNDGDISVLGNIIETGKAVPEKALKLIKKTMDKLDGALEELDEKVKALQNATTQIELKNIEMTREFLDNYFVVREDLRNARFDLRKLARKTVTLTKDIKGLLEIWDGKSNFEIQEQFDTLKQFLTDAVPIFKSAEEKYKNAITSLSNSQVTFNLFKVGIQNMNTKGTTEYGTWTKTVRASVYVTTSAGTIGCIFADIFVTWGKAFFLNPFLCQSIVNCPNFMDLKDIEQKLSNS